MQGTIDAAQAAHRDGTRTAADLIGEANKAMPADVLRRLGIQVAKGGAFTCPSCKGRESSATFKTETGDYGRRWRCTSESCDAGGSITDLVSLVRGYSDGNAARWILGLPILETIVSTPSEGTAAETVATATTHAEGDEAEVIEEIGTTVPATDGTEPNHAGKFTTSIDSANAVENEVPAFVGSETRAEIVNMNDSSPNRAEGPRASVDALETAIQQHVIPYLGWVGGDRKPREIRLIKPGRGVKDCWIWTPDRNAEMVKLLRRAHGSGCNAYVTINPIRGDIVDEVRRRWTERNPKNKEEKKTTTDTDIERRAFIPIDVDPKRPSGTLATSAMVQAARELANRIIDEWYRRDFPNHVEPLFGHSGSGYQILIPCDIPADDDGDEIVKGLLELLAATYDTEAAHVDTTVSNRSRIMRICGTKAFYSDGSRFGAFKPYEANEGDVLTVEDLRPIVPKETRKATPELVEQSPPDAGDVASVIANSPIPKLSRQRDAKRRIDAYIEPKLDEITAAAEGKKHDVLYWKTADIANYVAGAGLQAHESEYKGRIRDALKANAGHVESWEQADKTIDDAWAKGIADLKALPDREPPAKPHRANNAEVSPADDGSDDEPKPEYNGRRYYDPHIIATRFLGANDSPIVVVKGVPYRFDSGVYRPIADSDLTAEMTGFTTKFFARHHEAEKFLNDGEYVPIRPVSAGLIRNVRLAVDGICTDSRVTSFPAWRKRQPDDWAANHVVNCKNGLLNPYTNEFMDHTPRWLSVCKSEADWHGIDAPCPRFLRWLNEVMPGDDEEAEKSRETLQMWFGYLLVADRSHHKILNLVGERRTGKGTTLRLIRRLVGEKNVCQTSLTEISSAFGLQPLLNKTVAMIGDSRPGKANADLSTGAERLLALSGGDCLAVNIKNKDILPDVDLPARVVIASNGNFNMPDPNGVLPTRLVTLRFDQSFAGRENSRIEAELIEELPGILAWAVRGLQKLTELGGFHDLESTRKACEISQEIAQPLIAFTNAVFTGERGDGVDFNEAFHAYVGWLARYKPGAKPINKGQFQNEIESCGTGAKVNRPKPAGGGPRPFRLTGVTPNDSFDGYRQDGIAIIERQIGITSRGFGDRF